MRRNYTREETMYKNNMDPGYQDQYIGLDNKICENPEYYCKIHLVYLSSEDVERKKCLCKPSFDMIGTHRCKSLMTIDEYKDETTLHKENISKIIASRENLGMHNYKKKEPKLP